MMKILIAPGTFKGSLTAAEAADAMERGARRAAPDAEIHLKPVGDGGEGTADALMRAMPGSREVRKVVLGPLQQPVQAAFVLLGMSHDSAALDMASAAGLLLIPEIARDPMRTTTYGVGQLIHHALETPGVKRLIIGLGGSATNDAGAGCLQGIGFILRDASGAPLPAPVLPPDLARVASMDGSGLPIKARSVAVTIACDVDNPLAGPRGASRVFGPQKGASPEQVEVLDGLLSGFGHVLDSYARRSGVGNATRISERPGAGAAGGLGAALMAAFPQAEVTPGIDVVLDVSGFDETLIGANLVLTGEGKLDGQTLGGKAIHGVLRRAGRAGARVVAITGSAEPEAVMALKAQGLNDAIQLVTLAGSVSQAIEHANRFVATAAEVAVLEALADQR